MTTCSTRRSMPGVRWANSGRSRRFNLCWPCRTNSISSAPTGTWRSFTRSSAGSARPAIPALTAYMADRQNPEFPRPSAANGLCQIGKRHPEAHDKVVGVLTRQLANNRAERLFVQRFPRRLPGGDIQAAESAEAIERAYAAGVVDETVCGDWTSIRKELGVEGLGLVPESKRISLREPDASAEFV